MILSNKENIISTISCSIDEHISVIRKLGNTFNESLENAISDIVFALNNGGTIFVCGNGGSSSDSQHFVAELVGRFKYPRKALRAVSLTSDTSVLTCISNDFGYENIFSRQVEALGKEQDVLIAISTSGKSQNIINCLYTSKSIGLKTIALLGDNTDSVKNYADHILKVPSSSTQRIQECHILILHLICELIEEKLNLD